MALNDLTQESILKAIDEYDDLGRDEFLRKHSFHTSRGYALEYQGNLYDSKAIAGVAHGYLESRVALRSSEFSGGRNTVKRVIEALGFSVIEIPGSEMPSRRYELDDQKESRVKRNEKWSRDELVLALDLYLQSPEKLPDKKSPEVLNLSIALNKLRELLGNYGDEKYRNTNGVYMKLMNFRRYDPVYIVQGKTGLSRGGGDVELVWNEFAGDVQKLKETATNIYAVLNSVDGSIRLLPLPDVDFVEAEEGAILSRQHISRERNRKLVDKKKRSVLEKTGALVCEVCDFDFSKVYGDRGVNIIDVHHVVPLHASTGPRKTTLSDLALVCANCHRMIHSKRKWLTIQELAGIIHGRKEELA